MYDRFLLGRYKDNGDLQRFLDSKPIKTTDEIRNSARICIIDDEPFQAKVNLLSYGFKIDEFTDIPDIKNIEQYQIIIIDLIGVGRHFNSALEGASLIEEIKRRHPEKVVITYTGASRNDKTAKRAQNISDYFLKKDVDLDEFVNTLDEASNTVTNPAKIWQRIRVRLAENNATTKTLLLIEDSYVRSIMKSDRDFHRLSKSIDSSDLGQDMRNIIRSFISSAAVALIFG